MNCKVGDEVFARIKIDEIKNVCVDTDKYGWEVYEDMYVDEHGRNFFKEELSSPIQKIKERMNTISKIMDRYGDKNDIDSMNLYDRYEYGYCQLREVLKLLEGE